MKREYTKNVRSGILTLRPARRFFVGQRLKTVDNRIATVTATNVYFLKCKIKGKEYSYPDTGNYIGSRCPHVLDVSWGKDGKRCFNFGDHYCDGRMRIAKKWKSYYYQCDKCGENGKFDNFVVKT